MFFQTNNLTTMSVTLHQGRAVSDVQCNYFFFLVLCIVNKFLQSSMLQTFITLTTQFFFKRQACGVVMFNNSTMIPVADLRGSAPNLPSGNQNFLNFMQFFGNFVKNYILALSPWRVSAPSYGESWIRPWIRVSDLFMEMISVMKKVI